MTPPPAANGLNETAIELGAGAIALLALGGAAVALNRRRHRRDTDERWTEETHDVVRTSGAPEPAVTPRHDPVAEIQPPFIAPPMSAFRWGNPAQVATKSDDRRPAGETWVERAYRGPTADNPSLSLRKRLKRAAFFDKRDREAAAGHATRIEPDAGLPDELNVRELETA